MSGYSMTTKIKSDESKIGGEGLLKIIERMAENFDAHTSPFHDLSINDFADDPSFTRQSKLFIASVIRQR
jgi:hypothetical protein